MSKLSESGKKYAGFKGLIGIAREDITPPVGVYARNWGGSKT
ncbi:hypothetical protein N8843_09205 [Verrucomicrobia bacterium]|nr:hypothetical protein [Verrucomicrobiota bacterium]